MFFYKVDTHFFVLPNSQDKTYKKYAEQFVYVTIYIIQCQHTWHTFGFAGESIGARQMEHLSSSIVVWSMIHFAALNLSLDNDKRFVCVDFYAVCLRNLISPI